MEHVLINNLEVPECWLCFRVLFLAQSIACSFYFLLLNRLGEYEFTMRKIIDGKYHDNRPLYIAITFEIYACQINSDTLNGHHF